MGECFHTAVVQAPVDRVWAVLSNFHDMDWAAGVIETVEVRGDKGAREVGAQRLLNGAIAETLQSSDVENYRITYSIDDGPPPLNKDAVSNYTGTVQLKPLTTGGGTFVQWTSKYTAKEDAAVGDFCNPIYAALLEKLSAHFDT